MTEQFVARREDLRAKRKALQDPVNVAAPVDSSVERLMKQLNDPLVDRRFEAARALAKVDQPHVVQTLSSMIQRDVNRREALAALLLSDDPAAQRALADATCGSRVVGAQVTALKHELRKGF
jgi:hypothetical protein